MTGASVPLLGAEIEPDAGAQEPGRGRLAAGERPLVCTRARVARAVHAASAQPRRRPASALSRRRRLRCWPTTAPRAARLRRRRRRATAARSASVAPGRTPGAQHRVRSPATPGDRAGAPVWGIRRRSRVGACIEPASSSPHLPPSADARALRAQARSRPADAHVGRRRRRRREAASRQHDLQRYWRQGMHRPRRRPSGIATSAPFLETVGDLDAARTREWCSRSSPASTTPRVGGFRHSDHAWW